MAKKEVIQIEDEWLVLNELGLSAEVLSDLEKLVIFKPIRISLEVVLPKDVGQTSFDYKKNKELRIFRKNLESKTVECLTELAQDDPEDAEATLKKLNEYLGKAVKAFRVQLRNVIAKEIGGKTKADDLMTMGAVIFDELQLLFGVEEKPTGNSELLDLTKALKRVNKVQYCGLAWKGHECVLSVKLKKPFKEAELKLLKEIMPEGSGRGAATVAGEFVAFSKNKIELAFPDKAKTPPELVIRFALKTQTGHQVQIRFRTMEPENKTTEATTKSEKGTKDSNEGKKTETKSSKPAPPKGPAPKRPAPPKGPAPPLG